MAVDLSLAAVVNAAGALLFFLEGIGILVFAGASLRGRLIGGTALAFGAAYVFQNILVYDGTSAATALPYLVCASAAAFLALLLARHLAKDLPASPARMVHVALLGIVIGTLILVVEQDRGIAASFAFGPGFLGRLSVFADTLVEGALIVLVATVGARLRALPAEASRERRAMAHLALAIGLWPVFSILARSALISRVPEALLVGVYFAYEILTIVAVLAFVPTRRASDPAVSRAVLVGLLLVGLAAILLGPIFLVYGPSGFGAFGVVRTIGAAFLAVAILKHDLLGVTLPRIAVRRGVLAAVALATLFIVAQIAQNFFAAKYGLLMGGVVAGAFLFASSPLQQAMERLRAGERNVPVVVAASLPTEKETSFRIAIRMALKDGHITREEDRHLIVLADHLGIRPAHAYELRDEVEREIKTS